MEQALLDGEHQTEMSELHREQEIINQLKLKHEEIVEKAALEREKVCHFFYFTYFHLDPNLCYLYSNCHLISVCSHFYPVICGGGGGS